MKVGFYMLKDELNGYLHLSLHSEPNDETAKRSFAKACQDEDTDLYLFPLHYTLWKVFDLDTEHGDFVSDLRPIARASDYVLKRKEVE